MKRTTKTLIVAAAVTGLLAGTAVQRSHADGTNAQPGKEEGSKRLPKEHDCSGQNDCKGLGGCKTSAHACKGQNDCKSKGGCSITKDDIKNWDKITKGKKSS